MLLQGTVLPSIMQSLFFADFKPKIKSKIFSNYLQLGKSCTLPHYIQTWKRLGEWNIRGTFFSSRMEQALWIDTTGNCYPPQTGIAALTLTVMKGFEAKKGWLPYILPVSVYST